MPRSRFIPLTVLLSALLLGGCATRFSPGTIRVRICSREPASRSPTTVVSLRSMR